MHHLLLLVVLFGWVLFLFLSWQLALPLYVLAVTVTLAIYWKIIISQRRAPVTGKRAMIGGEAVVVSAEGDDVEAEYGGEIWRVLSPEPLEKGQRVIIKDVEGMALRVVPVKPGNDSSR